MRFYHTLLKALLDCCDTELSFVYKIYGAFLIAISKKKYNEDISVKLFSIVNLRNKLFYSKRIVKITIFSSSYAYFVTLKI